MPLLCIAAGHAGATGGIELGRIEVLVELVANLPLGAYLPEGAVVLMAEKAVVPTGVFHLGIGVVNQGAGATINCGVELAVPQVGV